MLPPATGPDFAGQMESSDVTRTRAMSSMATWDRSLDHLQTSMYPALVGLTPLTRTQQDRSSVIGPTPRTSYTAFCGAPPEISRSSTSPAQPQLNRKQLTRPVWWRV